MSAPAPGLHSLTEADYNALPALRSSDIPAALRSWAHFREARRLQRADTEAFRLGRLAHAMIAGTAAEQFRTLDGAPVNPRTQLPFGPETKAYADWLASLPADPREVVSRDTWRLAEAVADSVRACPAAVAAIDGAVHEASFVGRIEGVLCKARVDYWRADDASWADTKTTSAYATEFGREAVKFSYLHKAAFQSLVIESAMRGRPGTLRWIVVEKAPPHGVIVYRMSAEDLLPWADDVRRLVREYAECEASGVWPGYADDDREMDPLPWAYPKPQPATPEEVEAFS